MWDIKYRPVRFSDVLGQEGTVQVLKSRLRKRSALDTSYIFSGGQGRGKTTLARVLGKAMLCKALTEDSEPCLQCENCIDIENEASAALFEMDAASKGTIEHARAIVDNLPFVVQGATKRVYIFDEVHRMSRDAQDVLLKPLEDKLFVGIFCTTEPNKIRGPIQSRCEEHPIRPITRQDIFRRMQWILQQEHVEFEDDAVLTIIDHERGHVRDIINNLEMIAQLGPVTLEAVREHLNLSVVSTYYEVLLSLHEPAKAIRLVEQACDRVGPEAVSEGLAEAAMNSFRLAHGILADFSFIDRDLAGKVHAAYGDLVTKFAEFFLRSHRVTQMSLISDVLACRTGVPAQGDIVRPVAQQVSVPTRLESASIQAPVAQQVSVPTRLESASIQAPVAQQVEDPSTGFQPPGQPPSVFSNGNGRREDGVGTLRSGDPRALTDEDPFAVPKELPRGAVSKPKVPQPVVDVKEQLLSHQEWRRKFYQRWTS